jgi:NhaP-type Na+/H+ and K+/H+ antiporter
LNWVTALSGIASTFSIAIVLGGILSVAWVLVLERYKAQKYTYVLTIGLLLLTYSLVAFAGGSGELGVFVFGLIFGNYKVLNYIRKRQIDMDSLTSSLTKFQDEISFLLNSLPRPHVRAPAE